MSILSNQYWLSWYFKICTIRSFSSKIVRTLNELLMAMPKDNKVTVELKKQRQKLKEKNMKYTSGSVTLQVLGSGAKGTPRALYVFTDQSRYLFNCGEGTQRLAHEHKMKLSKLEHIFITHPCWENIGGLPGVALTIQDVGVPEITIHGPQGMADIFMATRRFVVLKDLNVKFHSPTVGQFEDSVMHVNYIPISPIENQNKTQHKIEESDNQFVVDEEDDEEDYYAYEKNGKGGINHQMKRRKIHDDTERKRLRSNGQWGKVGKCSLCYVCRLHPRQGTLLLDKCVELGVPPGPLLGKLKSGQDVTLSNGVIVRASDVCSPPDPGPVFLVIDCPSTDYIDAVVSTEELSKYCQSQISEREETAMAVVHFCPPEVLSDSRYLEWVERFPPTTTHLSFGKGNLCTGSVAVHRLQHKLNLLCPKIFPILADCGIPNISSSVKEKFSESKVDNNNKNCSTMVKSQVEVIPEKNMASEYKSSESRLIKARTFYNIHLRPRKGFDSSAALQMDCQEFVDETLTVDGFKEAQEKLRKQLDTIQPPESSFPKVLFLGTGSCIPNKARNTSGILIEISKKSCMLLDCGEGTYGQLVRFFGKEESDAVLSRLHCVFVSHLHADHHIGLISLLKQRQLIYQNNSSVLSTLYLLAPRQIIFWLSFYHDHFEPVLSQVKLVPCSEVVDRSIEPTSEHPPAATDMTATLGLQRVVTAPVCHCPNAFGVAISHSEGWKITYSGDTMPCDELVKLGKGSDLLIHEATMEDELVEEARAKRHSTTSEAIRVGQEMNAHFTILTHFSQRYAKLPRMKGSMNDSVGIAFDNMQVTLHDLKILPVMYPALKLMFADHCEEMDQKASRRKLKLERERANM